MHAHPYMDWKKRPAVFCIVIHSKGAYSTSVISVEPFSASSPLPITVGPTHRLLTEGNPIYRHVYVVAPNPYPAMEQPNIVLLVLDAVRVDHVGCYGYERNTTPNIDELARRGVKYANAFAPSIWTPAVHGAIFTGQYPSHTGTYGNSLAIPDHLETLPEALREAGYRTFAASAGAHIRRDRGYDRGVDQYVETRRISPELGFVRKLLTDRSFQKQVSFSLRAGPDDKTLFKFDRLKRFAKESKNGGSPFFAFVNAKTAHSPYNPPRPYKGLFCEELERPRWEVLERILSALDQPTQTVAGQDDDTLLQVARTGGDGILAGRKELTDEEWAIIEAWYDGAIRYMDDQIGSLVDELNEIDAFENTLLVVTSDHGENFGDHGLTRHVFCLYDSLLQVPLIVSPPSRHAMDDVVTNQVSLIDLYPTFLDVAGADLPTYDHSTSLYPFDDRQFHEYTFAEYAGYEGPANRLKRKYPNVDTTNLARTIQSVRTDEYKLIRDERGEVELYRWREDETEHNDLADKEPEMVGTLSEVLESSLGTLRVEGELENSTDEDLQEQLKALGYR